MSGNPRWMYARDGSSREPHDFASLLAEVLAAAAEPSREREIARSSRSDRGSGGGASAGVRVPAADQEVMPG
jgi:hypothetical protein